MSQTIAVGCPGAMRKRCLRLFPRAVKTSEAWAWDCQLPGAVLRQIMAVCACTTVPGRAVFLPSICHDTRCRNLQGMRVSNDSCGILECWLRHFLMRSGNYCP